MVESHPQSEERMPVMVWFHGGLECPSARPRRSKCAIWAPSP
jgi:hypothetical protein